MRICYGLSKGEGSLAPHRVTRTVQPRNHCVSFYFAIPAAIMLCLRIAAAGQPSSLSPSTRPTEQSIAGFGAQTQGAAASPSGFATYRVKSLADAGPGTLRDALTQGNRLIVFDVGGVISLKEGIYIKSSCITIDGTSAPPPGITILRSPAASFVIEAGRRTGPLHDIIVRNLRFERGPGPRPKPNTGDVLAIDGEVNRVRNVVFDHITVHRADDGAFDMRCDVENVTVSWCLIADTMEGTLLSGRDDKPRRNISLHNNVWARNTERMPRLRNNVQTLDMVNNLIYQWDVVERGHGATQICYDPGSPPSSANLIGNVYIPGPGNPASAIVYGPGRRPEEIGFPPLPLPQEAVWEKSRMGRLYIRGNLLPAQSTHHWSTIEQPLPIPAWARVNPTPADSLVEKLLPGVGAHPRTPQDELLIRQIARDLAGRK